MAEAEQIRAKTYTYDSTAVLRLEVSAVVAFVPATRRKE